MSELEEILKKYNLFDKKIEFGWNGEDYEFNLIDLFYNPQTHRLHLVYELKTNAKENQPKKIARDDKA